MERGSIPGVLSRSAQNIVYCYTALEKASSMTFSMGLTLQPQSMATHAAMLIINFFIKK
jgi:hypothetical protein